MEGQVARLQTMMDKEEDEKAGETSGLLDKPDSSSSGGAEPEPDVTKLAPLLCRRIPGVYIPVFCVRPPQVDFVFGSVTFVCEVRLYVRRRTPRDTVFPQSFPIAAI